MSTKRDTQSGTVEGVYTAEQVQESINHEEGETPTPDETAEHIDKLVADGKVKDQDPRACAKAIRRGDLFTIPSSATGGTSRISAKETPMKTLPYGDTTTVTVTVDYEQGGRVVEHGSFVNYLSTITKEPTTTADLAAKIAADFQQATGTGNTVHVSAYFIGVTDEAWNGAVSQDDLDLTMGV